MLEQDRLGSCAVIVRRSCLAAGLAAGLIAAGCGGGGSSTSADSVKVKQTVQHALADLANSDGRGFCALATTSGQAQLARTLPGTSCAKLVALVGAHLSKAARAGLLHVQVKQVRIKGSTATVRAADITSSQGSLKGFLNDSGKPTTLLRQADGTWKINA
jgi:hypothetical protein